MRTKTQLPAFDSEAHRGGRGLMPENTIPAMLNALQLGVTTLEMDAVITADSQVVLSHEPFFNREITTLPDGTFIPADKSKAYNIYKLTYAEVQRFDVGLKPNSKFPKQLKVSARKPLLTDVIDSAESFSHTHKRKPPFYNIETKSEPQTDGIYHPGPSAFVDLLMNVITAKKVTDMVIIQSFDFRTLKVLHQKYPAVRTAALVFMKNQQPEQVIKELGFTPTIYSPEYTLVNEEMIRSCHALGMRILPWTVNTAADISRLKKMGVDGIISDYPDLFGQ